MGTKHMHMTRLMCSKDRQEVETLKSKLFKAGVRSEVRSNPVARGLGITRLEVFIDERDLLTASKVRQDLETVISADDLDGSPGGGGTIKSFVNGEESELVTKAEVLPSPSSEPPQEESPGRGPKTAGAEPEGEFAQATALLEKEVEELLVREGKLIDRCCSLEGKVKTLDQSVAQARADLAHEVSDRSNAEMKLAEVCEARASLEEELQALEVRFKASEQALAASQSQLESQTREFSDQQARIASLEKDVSSRDAQLERIAESLSKARAGMEQEKDLRLATEQKSGDLAAALKSLECQLAQQAQQREQLLRERQDEHEQMRACVGKVNDLRSRVSAKLVAKEKP
jgi:predicted  nucleic acid-binding Zn-ribbon protein